MSPRVMGGKTQRLWNRMTTINDTIAECINKGRLFPTLILIYSSIDILASLQTKKGNSTDKGFKKWVSNYLFTEKSFACTANELWGARCGIVHTMRYDSEVGNAREVVYGFHWHETDIERIEDLTKEVGVYVDDLFDAFKAGCEKYLLDLENSQNPNVDNNLAKLPDYDDIFYLGEY